VPVAAVLEGYQAEAEDLIPRFEALPSAEILAPVARLLPQLAAQGHRVLAVEPVRGLREAGEALHPDVEWLDDALPELRRVRALGRTFDRVHLTAVWQHLPPEERVPALATLAGLVAPRGLLILSVRHGPGAPGRPVFAASADEVVRLAEAERLVLVLRETAESVQAANRAAGVTWTWLAFEKEGEG
jgi:hypothetical protein